MHFRSCTISIVHSALTSHLNWATVQQYEPWWQAGEGRAAGRTDGSSQISIEVHSTRLPACRAYIQALSSDGDTDLCASSSTIMRFAAQLARRLFIVRVGLLPSAQFCRNLTWHTYDKQLYIQITGYQYIGNCVFWHLEKMSLFYDPWISRPLTFGAWFCRKFCDLYASIYGNRKSYTSFRFVPLLMTLKCIWRSFQLSLSFSCPFQQSLACFRFARSPSNSWASCYYCYCSHLHSQHIKCTISIGYSNNILFKYLFLQKISGVQRSCFYLF